MFGRTFVHLLARPLVQTDGQKFPLLFYRTSSPSGPLHKRKINRFSLSFSIQQSGIYWDWNCVKCKSSLNRTRILLTARFPSGLLCCVRLFQTFGQLGKTLAVFTTLLVSLTRHLSKSFRTREWIQKNNDPGNIVFQYGSTCARNRARKSISTLNDKSYFTHSIPSLRTNERWHVNQSWHFWFWSTPGTPVLKYNIPCLFRCDSIVKWSINHDLIVKKK